MALTYLWLMLVLLSLVIWMYRTDIYSMQCSIKKRFRKKRYVTAMLGLVWYLLPGSVFLWGEFVLGRHLWALR